jgi:hypothetical protein
MSHGQLCASSLVGTDAESLKFHLQPPREVAGIYSSLRTAAAMGLLICAYPPGL